MILIKKIEKLLLIILLVAFTACRIEQPYDREVNISQLKKHINKDLNNSNIKGRLGDVNFYKLGLTNEKNEHYLTRYAYDCDIAEGGNINVYIDRTDITKDFGRMLDDVFNCSINKEKAFLHKNYFNRANPIHTGLKKRNIVIDYKCGSFITNYYTISSKYAVCLRNENVNSFIVNYPDTKIANM